MRSAREVATNRIKRRKHKPKVARSPNPDVAESGVCWSVIEIPATTERTSKGISVMLARILKSGMKFTFIGDSQSNAQ
jgi:hypothetical protein